MVPHRSILDRAAPHDSFAPIARLLEGADRADVRGERDREHAHESTIRKGEIGHERDRGRHDAASPKFFAEPVADLRADALDVGSEMQTDAADRLAVDVDREARGVELRCDRPADRTYSNRRRKRARWVDHCLFGGTRRTTPDERVPPERTS